jgi:L-alanine-DL-glutamate epimerase-like enolase superfamily enzyme
LSRRNLEYVEEPVQDGVWRELGSVSVPLAADESLQRHHLSPRGVLAELAKCGVRYVVVKPMALGLQRSLDWAAEARELGLKVVVSHLLDGPVAMAAAAALALAMGSPSPAPGLGRHPVLDAWHQCEPAAFRGTRLVRTDAPGLGLLGSPTLGRTSP